MLPFDSQEGLHPLAGCAGILGLLNNILLLSSPWILGSFETSRARRASTVHPLFTSILYAILEPVYLVAFIWLDVSPWLLLLGLSPIHLLSTEICQSVHLPPLSGVDTPGPVIDKLSEERKAPSDRRVVFDLLGVNFFDTRHLALAWPVLTSATLDAAFLLFAADLACNPGSQMRSSAAYAMPFVGFMMYLLARLGDVRMVLATRRKGLFSVQAWLRSAAAERVAVPSCLACLACLFAVRTALGWLTSWITSYPISQLLVQPGAAVVAFTNSWLDFLLLQVAGYSSWLAVALCCVSVVLYVFGFFMLRRGEVDPTHD